MKKRIDYLMEGERLRALAAEPDRKPCTGCGWPVDDPELDLCCDCYDEIEFKRMLRGEYGKEEQAEARQSADAGGP